MPREITADYLENVRRSPEYFHQALVLPMDPGLLKNADNPLLVTGSGSSYSMALLLSDLFRRQEHQARAVYPYELIRHERLEDQIVVCISQSGQTTDIIDAVDRANDIGCQTVGVTAVPDSPLGDCVDHLIEFKPPGEYILSRSCGVMSCLARLLEVHRSLGAPTPKQWPSRASEQVTSTIEDRLSSDTGIRVADDYVFLAGGSLLSVAKEGALSVQEATFLDANAYDIKNFAHGRAFRYGEPGDRIFVFLEARDDDTDLFDTAESTLSTLGQESIRVSSAFEQPWAAADVLAWLLAFSALLNELVGLDLANPPRLDTVRNLLDHHTSPKQ